MEVGAFPIPGSSAGSTAHVAAFASLGGVSAPVAQVYLYVHSGQCSVAEPQGRSHLAQVWWFSFKSNSCNVQLML